MNSGAATARAKIAVVAMEKVRLRVRQEMIKYAGIEHPMALCHRTRSKGVEKRQEDIEYPTLAEIRHEAEWSACDASGISW